MSRGQMQNVTRATFNVPVDGNDISNLLPKTADSTGMVIVKNKHKLEYEAHVLSEAVRPESLCNILYYLREDNHFYNDIIVKPENVFGDLINLPNIHTNRVDTQSDNEDETMNITDLLANQLDIPIPINIEQVFEPDGSSDHLGTVH